MYYSQRQGQLTITVRSAMLTRNLSWIGNMSPFVNISIGNVSRKTHVHEKGGLCPKWGSVFTFDLKDITSDIIMIHVYNNHKIRSHELIGIGDVNIREVYESGQLQDFYELHYKANQIGNIGLTISYFPEQVQSQQGLLYPNNLLITQQTQFLVPLSNSSANVAYIQNSQQQEYLQKQSSTRKTEDIQQLEKKEKEAILYPNLDKIQQKNQDSVYVPSMLA